MTDALKMTDMQQRASIEFERQRHLANWLIESSPHMPNPTAAQQKQLQQHQQQLQQQQQAQLQQQLAAAAAAAAAATSGNANGGKKQFAGGKFKPNPMFLLAKIGQNLAPGAAVAGTITDGSLAAAAAATSTFNSQTNLPLQILQPAGGGRDGGKPKLRRFNSHDTSANMFSVAEFENARMARRNELENAALLRQRQRYKLNSLNSSGGGGGGGDCSTGESKGSKLSTESLTEPLVADQFLERFSLPRVIRLTYTSSTTSFTAGSVVSATAATTGDHTLTSSSSAESSSTAERSGSGSKAKSKKATKSVGAAAGSSNSTSGTTTTTTAAGGDLFLLYRYMKSYKSYHVFNTKAGTSRKKGYKIPQDYPGKSTITKKVP